MQDTCYDFLHKLSHLWMIKCQIEPQTWFMCVFQIDAKGIFTFITLIYLVFQSNERLLHNTQTFNNSQQMGKQKLGIMVLAQFHGQQIVL